MAGVSNTALDHDESDRADRLHWYAVYTMPRHEKSSARQLEARAIECFLPLYSVTRHWQHRHNTFELPLFPSYLFVRSNAYSRTKILTAPGVVYIVNTGGNPAAIDDGQIENLRRLLIERKAYPTDYLKPGNRVRFATGPFAGLEGSIIRNKGQLRLVVSVDTIMRSIAIEADSRELELACAPNEQIVAPNRQNTIRLQSRSNPQL